MSAHEFAMWAALYQENQFGELFAYERAGIVASTVANYAGMQRAKGAPPAEPADFMPYKPKGWKAREEEEEVEADPVAYFSAVAKGK